MKDPELLGENIVEHLRKCKEAHRATTSYWRRSKLWRAIRDYIGDNSKKECALGDKPVFGYGRDKKVADVRWYKGTGPSIHLDDVDLCPSIHLDDVDLCGKGGEVYFSMRIEVEFVADEDEAYWADYSRDPGTEKHFHIIVPIELELEFSKEKFDEWIKAEMKEKKERTKKEEVEKLRELVKKYPEVASEVLLSANLSQIPTRLQVKGEEKFVKK